MTTLQSTIENRNRSSCLTNKQLAEDEILKRAKSRILIVDDEEEIRGLFKETLEESGYTCFSASGGNAALQALAAEEVEVVVTDIMMPGMSGLTLFEHIQERYPDIAVIFVTAMDDVSLAVQKLKAGAYSYLVKPVTLRRLKQEVREALDKRSATIHEAVDPSKPDHLHDMPGNGRNVEGWSGEMPIRRHLQNPQQAPTTITPGSHLGRYQVQEEIGRGGCASVFRAYDADLSRYVALKVLPSYHTYQPSFVARFKQEARAVAKLSHSNIMPVYDFGEDKGFTYLVTKHVTGGTLHSLMGRKHSLPEILGLACPLADALDYAHKRGIVHRDIKPGNVLIDPESGPILADFGLARIIESSVHLTQTGWILGTPQYMSPEQALSQAADHRSDLYSFAIILYQLLLARPPFQAETPLATLLAHVHEPVPRPRKIDPDIDPCLEATLLKGLAKDPDKRYQTAGELVGAIASTPPRSG